MFVFADLCQCKCSISNVSASGCQNQPFISSEAISVETILHYWSCHTSLLHILEICSIFSVGCFNWFLPTFQHKFANPVLFFFRVDCSIGSVHRMVLGSRESVVQSDLFVVIAAPFLRRKWQINGKDHSSMLWFLYLNCNNLWPFQNWKSGLLQVCFLFKKNSESFLYSRVSQL